MLRSFAIPSALVAAVLAAATARAEQLPIHTYTTVEGLPRNVVHQILRDSRGFLWFATPEGVARFDGYGFTTYGLAQGMASEAVNDLRETSDGTLWIATDQGLHRFDPKAAGPRFTVLVPGSSSRARVVGALCEDHEHRLWCGTLDGLFRLDGGRLDPVALTARSLPPHERAVGAIYEDRHGALWVGMGSAIYRRLGEGRVERYEIEGGNPLNVITQFLEDRDGRLWMSTRGGLYRLEPEPSPERSVVVRRYGVRDGLGADWVSALLETNDGRLWAATVHGLSELIDGSFRNYATPNGLSDDATTALAEDSAGNLWVGTESGGAMKLERNGFTTYTAADGLVGSRVVSLFEDRQGEPCAVTTDREPTINCFDGARFRAVRPDYGRAVTYFGWGWNQTIFEDRTGDWWTPTGVGLFRFAPTARLEDLARERPKAVYGMRDGLAADEPFRLFEDSRGDVWVAPINLGKDWISRWERATGTFRHYEDAEGLPASWVSAFGEAPDGTLWIGFYKGMLARYRDGRFATFGPGDGVPAGLGIVQVLHRDRAGRLWIATDGGVLRTDDPAADHPHFVRYGTAQGLSSDAVRCMAEDASGRIYLATGRGVDRVDPGAFTAALGPIRHYTTADGLVPGELNAAFSDRTGAVWFGSPRGLSRMRPGSDPPRTPPPVMVTSIRVRGEQLRISELGESELHGIRLAPQQNQVQIEYLGLGFAPGESLRYQVRLDDADKEWSSPTGERRVNYASLAPGSYRFAVRAIQADGIASPRPATIAFTVVPPVWQRAWFRLLALLGLGALGYAVHRVRVRRLLELERVRTRIATDLHDDIGSSLSQIAILSELVRRQAGDAETRLGEPLSKIAGVSRELVASMSDIVWAINPRHDQLRDLTQRMRRFASDLLTASDVAFDFRMRGADRELRVGADVRREIFLIFKESLHNAVRHSGCSRIAIDLVADADRLELRVADDGKGIDPVRASDGHGLTSMRARAARIGGEVRISSAEGTVVELSVPLRHHRYGG